METIHPIKILSYKTYNSIGHLSSSRLGESDSKIDQNTENLLVKQTAGGHQLVIVQEKIDGSNVCVVNQNGKLFALSRSGYNCETSNQEQHRMFHDYMMKHYDRFYSLLPTHDSRVVGEWTALAHGTIYIDVEDPFVAFDLYQKIDNVIQPLPFKDFTTLVAIAGFKQPQILHMGGACPIAKAMKKLDKYRPDSEGLVYRLEENFKPKIIAKYVKHDKVDGKYLKDGQQIWNWRP